MTLGYYIRGSARDATDWALVQVTSRYHDEVVVEGLSRAAAETLYWQKLEELQAEHYAGVAAAELSLGDVASRRPRQLSLKF